MSDSLLATKLHIPPLRSDLIRRPQLIQRLNDGNAQPHLMTIISAPAGYGKTTLLSEWVRQLSEPVAWLSLEKNENISHRFWSYFFSALETIPQLKKSDLYETVQLSLQAAQPPLMEELLTDLVNELVNLETRVILVLDDLHAISDGKIHQDLVFLIDHLPSSARGLHLVIASRMSPPWPLARWRARNELTELHSSDLRFSQDEVGQLLNQTLQLGLSSQDVLAIQKRTEGWIAGLQMAALSIQAHLRAQGPRDVSHFIKYFTASNRFILDFLMDEVIDQQPAEIQNFLQETSILDQFTASLCEALTTQPNCQAILDQIERANLFLIPLDDERHWYRYHHLFTELLRKSLKQTHPDLTPKLHRRASAWFAENNLLSEAINHSLQAGDVQRVNDLVSENALAIVEQTELLDVLRQFDELSEAQISSQPWLCVAYAWVKASVDPTGNVERILQQAKHCLAECESSVEWQQLASHLAAVRAYVAWVNGEAVTALELVGHALENLTEIDYMPRMILLNIKGLAWQYLDNLPASLQAFNEALVAGQRTSNKFNSVIYVNIAMIYLMQGKLHQAISCCQKIIDLADESDQGFRSLPISAQSFCIMSMIQLEWNQVDDALIYARKSVDLAERWRQADTLHGCIINLSRTLGALGDLEAAFMVNKQAKQLPTYASPWYFQFSMANEVWLNLVIGDLHAAADSFEEIENLPEGKHSKGRFLVTKASLLYAQGCFPDIVRLLEVPIQEFEQRGDCWYLMKMLPIQALALQALGREEEALDVLDHCLDVATLEGWVRVFVEQGEPMVRLLKAALDRGINSDYIQSLLSEFRFLETHHKLFEIDKPKPQVIARATELIEPLSDRELQVLHLLDSPLTSEEISRELYISVTTVRTHIQNIYSKLGVHGRIEAIQRAKELGLI